MNSMIEKQNEVLEQNQGMLYVVGIGPGDYEDMTLRAVKEANDTQVRLYYKELREEYLRIIERIGEAE